MKKLILCGLVILSACFWAFAGDVAAFVDLGISSDGKAYVFAEYGKTDKLYQGYAEIYAVDIAKNDFISGGVFRTKPSGATVSKSGKLVFDELFSKANWWLKKYDCKPVSGDNILYVSDGAKKGDCEIVFKDYEGSTVEQSVFYHINLVKNIESNSAGIYSSFFITLEKKDENGRIISRNVIGNPDIKRKDVSGYKIDRIFSDASGRNLVFVVEKQLKDSNGISIRYMVETVHL